MNFEFDAKFTSKLAEKLATKELEEKYQQLIPILGRGVWVLSTITKTFDDFVDVALGMTSKDLYFVSFDALHHLIKRSLVEKYREEYGDAKLLFVFVNNYVCVDIQHVGNTCTTKTGIEISHILHWKL